MDNQYIDLHQADTIAIKHRLVYIRSKYQKYKPLSHTESLIVIELLNCVIDGDGYKIPKKHGGQKKYDDLYKKAIAQEVMQLVNSGEKVKDAIDIVCSEYRKGDEYVKKAYNQHRVFVSSEIKRNPQYQKFLEKELAR